jgi:peptide/nickel transport system permease protein
MKFLKYFSKRFLSVTFSLAALVSITFFLLDAIPGQFLDMQRANFGDSTTGRESFKNYEKEMLEEFHLDKPITFRISNYFIHAIQFKFGPSYKNRDVAIEKLVVEKLPVTFTVALVGLLLSIIVGIPIGIIAALKKNTPLDYTLMGFSTYGLAIPPYVLAVVLILIFAIFVRRFEFMGSTPLYFMRLPSGGWGDFSQIILPALALGIAPIASVARFIRSSILETLEQDFIQTAYSKGISKTQVVLKHALRPSLIPVITVMGPQFGYMLIGSVFVETIFRLPGIGLLFVQSIAERDVPLIVTSTFILAAAVMIINQIVDLLYSWIDPRIELE